MSLKINLKENKKEYAKLYSWEEIKDTCGVYKLHGNDDDGSRFITTHGVAIKNIESKVTLWIRGTCITRVITNSSWVGKKFVKADEINITFSNE